MRISAKEYSKTYNFLPLADEYSYNMATIPPAHRSDAQDGATGKRGSDYFTREVKDEKTDSKMSDTWLSVQ